MNPEFRYRLRRVAPRGYLVEVPNSYDLAMLFVRVQEYYESGFDDIKGKPFQLVELMHRYVHGNNYDTFRYTSEWSGFNVPSEVIERCLSVAPDPNFYDATLQDIVNRIKVECSKFYLIGVRAGDQETYIHELAHTLFHTNDSYRRQMERLVEALPVKNLLFKRLKFEGYARAVWVDEAQAYLATVVPGHNDPVTSGLAKFAPPFKRVFKRYTTSSPVITINKFTAGLPADTDI